MTISLVVTFQLRDGRQIEQVENKGGETPRGAGKWYLQGPSSTIRKPMSLVVVREYKDWNRFVKIGFDPEFSQLVGSANPAADLVGEDVYEELTICAAYVLKSPYVFIAAYRTAFAGV